MRLSCLQENLNQGLSVVGRAVASRTTLPITQNVLISTDQGRLKLSATNLEIAVTTWIGAQIEEEGSITVPARLLTDFVMSLPPERIDLSTTDQPPRMGAQCARFDAQINGTAAEDFPPIPTVESGVAVKISPQVLHNFVEHVAFAAATEDSRPVLTGVQVEIEGDDITFAAADGFRLAVHKGKLDEEASEDASFIIPARALQEVSRLIGGQQEPIEFTVTPSKSQALFRLENVEMVTQLIQGAFPNYSQLIPQSYETRVMVSLEDFLRATRTASIFARDGSGIVRLMVSEGEERGRGQDVNRLQGRRGRGEHGRDRRQGRGDRVEDRLQQQVPGRRARGTRRGGGRPRDDHVFKPGCAPSRRRRQLCPCRNADVRYLVTLRE